jgi:hypothetical protein
VSSSDQGPVRLTRAMLEDWILRYHPKEIDSTTWRAGLGDFVQQAMLRLDSIPDRYPELQRTTLLLARITRWSVDQGLPLDLELILAPENVERVQ